MQLGLCIGNNYPNSFDELSGCVADAQALTRFLRSRNIKVTKLLNANKHIIMKNIKTLIWKANRNKNITRLWLSYSGHGSYIKDRNGDEQDGQDEVLIPNDWRTRGFITDDWLLRVFKRLRRGVNVIVITDCCNSGTVLDLPFTYRKPRNNKYHKRNTLRARIFLLAACRDDQFAMEIPLSNNNIRGALTIAFLSVAKRYKHLKIKLLHTKIIQFMQRNQLEQLPQISSSRFIKSYHRIF